MHKGANRVKSNRFDSIKEAPEKGCFNAMFKYTAFLNYIPFIVRAKEYSLTLESIYIRCLTIVFLIR